MMRSYRGSVDIVDDNSSSGSDPFATPKRIEEGKDIEQKERNRVQRRISAMADEGPADWSLSSVNDKRLKELNENELQ